MQKKNETPRDDKSDGMFDLLMNFSDIMDRFVTEPAAVLCVALTCTDIFITQTLWRTRCRATT